MHQQSIEKLLKKALLLDTQAREELLTGVSNPHDKKKLRYLLDDDSKITQFAIKTAGVKSTLVELAVNELQFGDKIKQFIIKKLIAKGGMGSVYLAYDEKLKRNVAIKSIRGEYLNSESSIKRFEQEAQILSQTNHASICQIYDFLEYQDGHLLVLEYVRGQTLNHVQMSETQKLEVFMQITSALSYAHKQGIVHRDLKPDNIMLSDEGVAKILDFGIAKSGIANNRKKQQPTHDPSPQSHKTITKLGAMMGTLMYMSPEQAAAKEVDWASDIYTLGVIFHKILTGDYIYAIKNTDNLRSHVIKAQVDNIEKSPKPYLSLLKSMLQFDATKRPSAQQVLKQLQHIKEIPAKRKIRTLKIFAVLFSSVFVALFLWQAKTSKNHQQKSQFKQTITQQIDKLNTAMNKAYTFPKHDISAEIAAIKKQAQQTLAQVKIAPFLNDKEKNHYLGAIAFVLEDYAKANDYLKHSLNSQTNQEPRSQIDAEIAYKIAQSELLNYWHAHFNVGSRRNGIFQTREELLQNSKISLQNIGYYIDIAKKSDSFDAISETTIQAYSLFEQKQFQQALDIIDAKQAKKNGDYKQLNFIGNLYWELYKQNFLNGKYKTAEENLAKATHFYQLAIQYGRSFADSYNNLCNVRREKLESDIYNKQGQHQILYQQALESCSSATVITPKNSFAYDQIAYLNLRYAMLLSDRGHDIETLLSEALKWNQKALSIYPSPFSYKNNAVIHSLLAEQQLQKGDNPTEEINKALDSLLQALSIAPQQQANIMENYFYHLITKFDYLIQHGQAVLPEMLEAEKLFTQTIRQENFSVKENDYFYDNYADLELLTAQSLYQQGKDPHAWIKKSIIHNKQVMDIPGNDYFAKAGVLANQLLQVKIAFAAKQDISVKINEIIEQANSIKELEDTFSWFNQLRAQAWELKAKQRLRKQQDASQALEKMQQLVEKSTQMNPNSTENYLILARFHILSSTSTNDKKAQRKHLKLALQALQKGLAINPNQAQAYQLWAQIYQFAQDNKIALTQQNTIAKLLAKAKSLNPKIKPYLF